MHNLKSYNEHYDTEFPTYIIAYCPKSDMFFATNKRFFLWESEERFFTEKEAIEFFYGNIIYFHELRKGISLLVPNIDIEKPLRFDNTNDSWNIASIKTKCPNDISVIGGTSNGTKIQVLHNHVENIYIVKNRRLDKQHYRLVCSFKEWLRVYDGLDVLMRLSGTYFQLFTTKDNECIINIVHSERKERKIECS